MKQYLKQISKNNKNRIKILERLEKEKREKEEREQEQKLREEKDKYKLNQSYNNSREDHLKEREEKEKEDQLKDERIKEEKAREIRINQNKIKDEKTKEDDAKKKNNKKENMNIKINKISSNDNLDIINFKRSKSEKNTIKLNKNKNLQSNIKGKIKIIKNSNNKKFPDLICQKKVIVINYKDEKEKNDNQNSNEKKNNSNFDNQIEKKYNIIIEKLKSEIKIKEQYITKYELEKQIAEKNRKAILDSNSYQINGLNELIKLLKDKNQKLNVENKNRK